MSMNGLVWLVVMMNLPDMNDPLVESVFDSKRHRNVSYLRSIWEHVRELGARLVLAPIECFVLKYMEESEENGEMLKNGPAWRVSVACWDQPLEFGTRSTRWDFLAATNVLHLCKKSCMECSLDFLSE